MFSVIRVINITDMVFSNGWHVLFVYKSFRRPQRRVIKQLATGKSSKKIFYITCFSRKRILIGTITLIKVVTTLTGWRRGLAHTMYTLRVNVICLFLDMTLRDYCFILFCVRIKLKAKWY